MKKGDIDGIVVLTPNFKPMLTPEKQTLDALKMKDNAAFHKLYKDYFASIASFVCQNSGTPEDAEDVFQESVMILLDKIQQPAFVLSSSLQTYLYAIARNTWLKRLRDAKTHLRESEFIIAPAVDDPDEWSTAQLRQGKIYVWLQKITDHCRQIIKAIFFYQEPMDRLMAKMGWKNRHTADNQKYKCIQQIRKVSESDPL